MGEKFKPEFFEIKNGEMKRLSPEKSAEREKEIEKEEKELEEKERKRTIRLDRDATFADLCKALIKIEEKAQENEDEESLAEHIGAELIDHFDSDVISEVSDAIIQFETLGSKEPEKYTDEEKKLANLKVLEYFQEKGYSVEDIEAYLPLKFRKEKQKK